MVSKLSQDGKAAIILANGSLSAGGQEAEIRKKLIEADLVDCILSMPTNLFYTVTVPCSIWILNRNKRQKGHTLFINANDMGTMITRKLRELSEDDIMEIANIYHAYASDDNYEDVAGFCKKASIDEIKVNDFVLTPGRYVGIKQVEDDGEPFEEKMKRLTSELSDQIKKSKELDAEIKKVLGEIGYEI